MSVNPYTQPKRAFSGGFEKRFVLTVADVTQVLVAAYTNKPPLDQFDTPLYHAIHVQRLKVVVKTGSAGVTWQFGNPAPNATDITPALDMSTAGVVHAFDYNPQGARLFPGRDLKVTISAAGAAADVYVEGFQERTGDPIV